MKTKLSSDLYEDTSNFLPSFTANGRTCFVNEEFFPERMQEVEAN